MQRITLEQVESFEQFYRLPKIFFTSDKYKGMKLESKTAYAILRDRFELSISNGWVDDKQKVYFVFTISALGDLLSCGKNKVLAIKKDLVDHGLLEEVRQGLNKPNRLYLGLASDEEIEKSRSNPLIQAEVSKSNFKRFENQTSRGLKNKLQEVSKTNPNDTEFSNDNDDNVFNNARTSDQELLVDHYQKETGQQLNPVQARNLQQLSNIYGPLLVSEAITRAALNGTSSLLYVEKVSQTLAKAEQEQIDKMNQPTVPMTQLSELN